MSCRPGISSMSLGRAWVHEMPTKLDEAAAAGLEGIEVFFEDLEYLAQVMEGTTTTEKQKKAARCIRELCEARKLSIICLQPFLHSEGLRDEAKRAMKLEELKHWMDLGLILGTDLIQMPASFLPEEDITPDTDKIVSDMQEVADLGATYDPPFRFAMESLCFSTYINTWEQCYDIVCRVNRPNFGICLDTFNIGGIVYGDPADVSGTVPDAEKTAQNSIAALGKAIDPSKIFFIQVVDAQRLTSPLVSGHPLYSPEQPARMSWSRNCRLFYGEHDRGAYLPIKDITKAIIQETGYRGWISMEYFNADMAEPAPDTPRKLARRAMSAWNRIIADNNLSKNISSLTNQRPTQSFTGESDTSSRQQRALAPEVSVG